MLRRLAATLAFVTMLVMSGCAAPMPVETAQQDGNLHFVISNQSSERPVADFLVTVDGHRVLAFEAAFGDAHNWFFHSFNVTTGRSHVIVVKETNTGRSATTYLFVPNDGDRWAYASYWESTTEKARVTLETHDQAQGLL